MMVMCANWYKINQRVFCVKEIVVTFCTSECKGGREIWSKFFILLRAAAYLETIKMKSIIFVVVCAIVAASAELQCEYILHVFRKITPICVFRYFNTKWSLSDLFKLLRLFKICRFSNLFKQVYTWNLSVYLVFFFWLQSLNYFLYLLVAIPVF